MRLTIWSPAALRTDNVMSVSINPGETALTVIFRLASSAATQWVKPSTPPLLAA